MTLKPGTTLLQYRIADKIGEGGMGVVWSATDTSLNRDVAIKILPAAFAEDPERLARFEREARLLASLQHPNIAAVYGLHHAAPSASSGQEAMHFLVMELAEGEDLAKRLARGPLPVEDTLEIGRQIAEAVEAAHEQGVIHRDLKPANVQLAPDGTVKVLDFGLAKALSPDTQASGSTQPSLSLSPTMTSAGTVAGMILGTAAYMSPEQARAKPVDRRADIWAFGCVLYEMLTGRQAFRGETVSDCLAAVLRAEPDMDALPADTPRSVRQLIARCLRKDARRRLRDVGDARVALEEAMESPGTDDDGATHPAAVAPAWRRLLPWGVAAAAALLAVTAWVTSGTDAVNLPASPSVLSARLPLDTRMLMTSQQSLIALSPDGRQVVISANHDGVRRLYLRRLGRPAAVALPGTEGAREPVFSPDGEWISFRTGGKVWKLALAGGKPQLLAESVGNSRGSAWCGDTLVYTAGPNSGLMAVPAQGGEARALTEIDASADERSHRWPACLPDTGEVMFTIGSLKDPDHYWDSAIEAVSLTTGERRPIFDGASMARWSASGHLLLSRPDGLCAVRFDPSAGEPAGEPVVVMSAVAAKPASGLMHFDIARNGTLLYIEGLPESVTSQLVWVDREGEVDPLPIPPGPFWTPRISPDGKRVVYASGPSVRETDLWILDLDSGAVSRLTFEGGSVPIWTPDGKAVTFSRKMDGGGLGLFSKTADGSGEAVPLFEGDAPRARMANSWAPDGSRLLYLQAGEVTDTDLLLFDPESGESTDLVRRGALQYAGEISPDGRFAAYTSAESGEFEVYVVPFPDGGGLWQVSDLGAYSAWSADGTELFYISNSRMMVVPVRTRPTFSHGKPELLFGVEMITNSDVNNNYDVAADGRFLMVRPDRRNVHADSVNLVLNWSGELP